MFIKNEKAFTFVELLMVMLILGIIITLTMPLLNNLKNDEDIYRAYMKKAIHDVTDATNMVFIRERYLTDFSENSLNKLCSIYGCTNLADKYHDCNADCSSHQGLRAVYNLLAVPGAVCYGIGEDDCFSAGITPMVQDGGNNLPGIKNGSKSVMQFLYNPQDTNGDGVIDTFGEIYFDVNGNKAPNQLCQDRYKFIIYLDKVAMDGCDLAL
ncbi:MAG: prepilin-type N-terminal cleavage/methylation domain-containing protein [Candidatus Gastranaerophilales bacterium]|nr:prepilin-type N-terminal cleavage/methylation domain-containing protein [Candidatus Gastranaerophilales bacterium]